MPSKAILQFPDGTHKRYLTTGELYAMESRGEIHPVFVKGKGKAARCIGRLKPMPESTKTIFEGSPSAPTYQDTYRAMGLNPRLHSTLDVSRGASQASRERICQFATLRVVAAPKPEFASIAAFV